MQRPRPRTSGAFSRRGLIRAGLLGGCGLALPQLLRASDEHPAARARACIFLILSGGPGQHETFDPKPDAPREIRGQYGAIATRTPGIWLSEKLPELARRSDRYCLVRSMSHGDTVHVTAAHTMLSGQPDGSAANDSPFVGSLVSKFRPADSLLPSYVWLHNMKTGTNKQPRYDSGLKELGQSHAPLRIGYELDNPTSPTFQVRDFDPPEGLTSSQLQQRLDLLRRLDIARGSDLVDQTRPLRYDAYQQRAADLISGERARLAFDLSRENEATRDRYGRHPLGQYLLMARRLIEAGVRLVTVTGWPGLAPGETTPTPTQVWDTHDEYYSGRDNMYGNGPYGMNWALPRLDQGLSALLDDLAERGLLDETLVAVAGEFGRTPKFEGEGRGRGHWPACYSTLFAGGGVRAGLVYGASDSQGAYVAAGRPVSHVDFAATIFTALGIPLDARYGVDGFSLRVNDGAPLTEILS